MIELLSSIVNRLYEVFEEDIKVYTEEQEQGVELPCFFLRLINSSLERQFNDFFFLNNTVAITYMSESGDLFELENIRFKLLTGMEAIKLKNVGVTGENLQAQIRDKDVIANIDYNIWIEKSKVPDPLMMRLKQEGNIKE